MTRSITRCSEKLRELFATGPEPALVDVPELAFAMVDGHGDRTPELRTRFAPRRARALDAVHRGCAFGCVGITSPASVEPS